MPLKTRKNGFESPHSPDQKATWVVYPVTIAAYYAMVGVWGRNKLPLILAHGLLTVVLLTAYYFVETIDPAFWNGKPTMPVVCFPTAHSNSRYCASCSKSVVGLDHHCTWLNTCIGINNYVPFFTLVVTGFAQMALQVLVSSLFIISTLTDSSWEAISWDHYGSKILLYVFAGLIDILSLILMISFGVLMSFHLYLLLYVRAGTYEWMMGGRNVSPDTGAEVRAKKAHVDLEADRQRQRERFNLALQANRNRDAAYEKIEMAAVKKDQLTDFPEGDPALEAPQNVISSTDIQPAIDHKIAYTAV